MTAPAVSVVIPVHNEAGTLAELAARTLAAGRRADPHAELILVDDGSTDTTRDVPLPEGARLLSLPANRGQLRATRAGLAEAAGRVVVVLDGDLQDPPEPIPDLVRALRADASLDAVLMTKGGRDAPAWFHVGRAAYDRLQRPPGGARFPAGAGSYLALRGPLARQIAQLRVADGNLAAVVVGLGARVGTLPYAKAPREHGDSRVGGWGLLREGAHSLVLTGAAATWAMLAAVVALAWGVRQREPRALLAGVAAVGLAAAAEDARRRALSAEPPRVSPSADRTSPR